MIVVEEWMMFGFSFIGPDVAMISFTAIRRAKQKSSSVPPLLTYDGKRKILC
jgi:hypothetical protein